jgi:hypothetical protein
MGRRFRRARRNLYFETIRRAGFRSSFPGRHQSVLFRARQRTPGTRFRRGFARARRLRRNHRRRRARDESGISRKTNRSTICRANRLNGIWICAVSARSARRFRNGHRTLHGVDVRHRTRPRNDSVSANALSLETVSGFVGFAPENSAFEAGKVMLARLSELAGQKRDFAFETTLAARFYANWLKKR